MHRYFLEIAYKGTNFHGWQVQPNAPTVQETLQSAMQTYYRQPIETVGCGRTDTGVHATSYFLHFDLAEDIADPEKDIFKLNAMLPADIACRSLRQVSPKAHARFDAIFRKYDYLIHTQKDPFLEGRSMRCTYELDWELMDEACAILLQTTDFASFCKSGSDIKTTECHLKEARFEHSNGRAVFHIAADRFLRNMVRAIVGTLIDVGRGKIDPVDFRQIINAKSRSRAGKSAEACGLYLAEIKYKPELFL